MMFCVRVRQMTENSAHFIAPVEVTLDSKVSMTCTPYSGVFPQQSCQLIKGSYASLTFWMSRAGAAGNRSDWLHLFAPVPSGLFGKRSGLSSRLHSSQRSQLNLWLFDRSVPFRLINRLVLRSTVPSLPVRHPFLHCRWLQFEKASSRGLRVYLSCSSLHQ